jgi:hypothetical protein
MDANANQIRQKVQQSRDLAKQGHYEQAKALLKGINHPKVAEMIAQLDERIAAQPTARGAQFPLLPVAGLMGVVIVLVMGGGLLLSQRSRSTAEMLFPTPTATLVTAECTDGTITAWWQVQIQNDRELNTFAVNADAAFSTLPGERLTTEIEKLRIIRADALLDIPACASVDLQTAIADLLLAMDDVILALDRWNKGEATSGDLMSEYYSANESVRNAKRIVREALP